MIVEWAYRTKRKKKTGNKQKQIKEGEGEGDGGGGCRNPRTLYLNDNTKELA